MTSVKRLFWRISKDAFNLQYHILFTDVCKSFIKKIEKKQQQINKIKNHFFCVLRPNRNIKKWLNFAVALCEEVKVTFPDLGSHGVVPCWEKQQRFWRTNDVTLVLNHLLHRAAASLFLADHQGSHEALTTSLWTLKTHCPVLRHLLRHERMRLKAPQHTRTVAPFSWLIALQIFLKLPPIIRCN